MTVKEYLSQPKELKKEIRRDLDNLAAMRSVVENCTTQLSFTAGRNPSKNKDSFETMMIRITLEEGKIRAKIEKLAELEIRILKEIHKLNDTDQEAVLRLRYLEELPWNIIRKELGLGKSHVYSVHRDALAKLKISDTIGLL